MIINIIIIYRFFLIALCRNTLYVLVTSVQWQNCSLIFGTGEHLVQHLVKDHTNPNLETVKCRWRGCSTFFAKQQSVRQVTDAILLFSPE